MRGVCVAGYDPNVAARRLVPVLVKPYGGRAGGTRERRAWWRREGICGTVDAYERTVHGRSATILTVLKQVRSF
jgi:hypothetical protein